jgi:hypothetical protein
MGCCAHGKVPLDFMQGGELSVMLVSQEALYYMELVSSMAAYPTDEAARACN